MTVDTHTSDGEIRYKVVAEAERKAAAARQHAIDMDDLEEAVKLARDAIVRKAEFEYLDDALILLNTVFSDETDEMFKRFDTVKRAQEDNGDLTEEMVAAICDAITEAVWFGLTAANVRLTRWVEATTIGWTTNTAGRPVRVVVDSRPAEFRWENGQPIPAGSYAGER